MNTLDQALEALVASGQVGAAEARSRARFPENF